MFLNPPPLSQRHTQMLVWLNTFISFLIWTHSIVLQLICLSLVTLITYCGWYLPTQVPPAKTLITPVQCKSLWRQFKTETEYSVTQAISAQVLVHKYYAHNHLRPSAYLVLRNFQEHGWILALVCYFWWVMKTSARNLWYTFVIGYVSNCIK